MAEWQPIETAPKDGTRLLLDRIGENFIRSGFWEPLASRELTWPNGKWSDGERYFDGRRYWAPTHWMYAPEGPK